MDIEDEVFNKILKYKLREQAEYWKSLKRNKKTDARLISWKEYQWKGIDVYDEFNSNIASMLAKGFADRINCGGYALQVDGCFFPNGDKFSGYISALLEKFDFIRLLGDKPLQDDEYLVFYRFAEYEESKGKNKGHHFIRVDDDGLVVEKCGNEPPRIFKGWNEDFKDSPEAVFAVKKEHDILFDDKRQQWGIFYDLEKGLDFDDSVNKAIQEKSNSFNYHCRNYRLKKSQDGEIFVTNEEGEIIADLLEDETERIAVVRTGKEDYNEDEHYLLITAYVGTLANSFREPWDRNIRSDVERAECEAFWSNHALIYDPEQIDWERMA